MQRSRNSDHRNNVDDRMSFVDERRWRFVARRRLVLVPSRDPPHFHYFQIWCREKRVVKSVLPVPISTKSVGFAVNGTIFFTFMWVLKAFLQVICALGSVVFVSILIIRGISYLQENRSYRTYEDEPRSWNRSQPAA